MKRIGDIIAMLRKERNMTQEEVAASIGVSPQSISKWENSASMPDIMLLPVIADFFGVSIDELFGKPAGEESTVSLDDLPEKAYDAVLAIVQKSFLPCDDVSTSESKKTHETEVSKMKTYLTEHPGSQSLVFSDKGGAVYVNSDLGLVLRKRGDKSAGMVDLLSNIEIAEFLEDLSDKSYREVLIYLLKNKGLSFTSASISKKCGITIEEADAAINKLIKHGIITQNEVDIDCEHIFVYQMSGGNKILLIYTLLKMANIFVNYTEHYNGLRGTTTDWYNM